MSQFNQEPPKEIVDEPTLRLIWGGLSASIAANNLTCRQAIEILRGTPTEQDPDDEPPIAA